jgi:hypothetical protein
MQRTKDVISAYAGAKRASRRQKYQTMKSSERSKEQRAVKESSKQRAV